MPILNSPRSKWVSGCVATVAIGVAACSSSQAPAAPSPSPAAPVSQPATQPPPQPAAPRPTPAPVATSRTTRDGVYTLEQANNGKNIFLGSCVSCHTPRDLVGGGFWAGLIGKSVTKFFTYVRENMPQDNPASLSDDDYIATVAYVLQLNGMPPGQAPLAADTAVLTKIKFVAPDSPPHHFSTGR